MLNKYFQKINHNNIIIIVENNKKNEIVGIIFSKFLSFLYLKSAAYLLIAEEIQKSQINDKK